MAAALSHGDALAHAGDERPLTNVPPAPPGTDGAKAEAILREIGGQPADAQRVVAEPVAKARRALGRAHGARAAGDQEHARKLHGLALEWAEGAQTILRAAGAEAKAQETAQKAREVETQLVRARTLLAETQARQARAAAELARVEASAREAAQAAAAAEQARVDASRKPGAGAGKPGAGKPGAGAGKPAAGKPAAGKAPAGKGGGR